MTETKTTLLKIIEEQFGEVYSLETSFSEIDKWDSLTHMILINKIETTFELKFDLMDMLNFDTLDSIYQTILRSKK